MENFQFNFDGYSLDGPLSFPDNTRSMSQQELKPAEAANPGTAPAQRPATVQEARSTHEGPPLTMRNPRRHSSQHQRNTSLRSASIASRRSQDDYGSPSKPQPLIGIARGESTGSRRSHRREESCNRQPDSTSSQQQGSNSSNQQASTSSGRSHSISSRRIRKKSHPSLRDPFSEAADPMPVSPSNRTDSVSSAFSKRSDRRPAPTRFFRSRKINKNNIERSWKEKKSPREKWINIIPLIGLALGLGVAGFLIWDGWHSVIRHDYCHVMTDNFKYGFDTTIWTKEAEVGGFGNGQFEETTTSDENVYVENGKLFLKPTLQDPSLITEDNTINLTETGTCTASSRLWYNCISSTNTTNGTIVQPVKSGRISTRDSYKIKYGRVEVTATLPEGDWLWPAIWMLPTEETYGAWPASGEIDIVESRGNNYTYPLGGNDIMSSTLHWGPDPQQDGYWQSSVKRQALHTTYYDTTHTFGLEWSEKYIFTYVNSRLLQVLYFSFDAPLWARGGFSPSSSNGTKAIDTWSQTGRSQTPFDQDFYLIINLAVGGTNGWFQDGIAGKPWVDESPTAKKDFWDARDVWQATWKNEGKMVVEQVKMWQQCDGHEEPSNPTVELVSETV